MYALRRAAPQLTRRPQVVATKFQLGSIDEAEHHAAASDVQAARSNVRDAVLATSVCHPSVLPLLQKLQEALAVKQAYSLDESLRVAADIAFLRGDPGADTETDTRLAALLHVAKYLAPSHRAAAESMMPQLAELRGGVQAELFFDQAKHEWTVREVGGGEIVLVPPAVRCARPGCGARGAKVCSACRAVRYCGPECSKAHWKLKPGGHKAMCAGKA